MIRVFRSILVILSIALTATGVAANGAPHPIERGGFYFSGGLAYENLDRPNLRYLRLYKDDSSITPSGLVTLDDDEGHLLSIDLKERKEVLPHASIGYGANAEVLGIYDGIIRLEVTGHAYETDSKGSKASATPETSGFTISDGAGGTQDVGLFAAYNPINGKDVGDLGFLASPEITNIALETEERFITAGFNMYLDQRIAGWDITRFVGLHYAYQKQDFKLRFNMPLLLTEPSVSDDSFLYDYKIDSHHFNFPIGLSIGRTILGVTPFVNGSAALGFVVSKLSGRQEGACLSVCQISTAPFDLTRGVVRHKNSDVNFSYDARVGAGATIRFWLARVTAEVGAFHSNRYATPFEPGNDGGAVESRADGYWGYFGKATATLIF